MRVLVVDLQKVCSLGKFVDNSNKDDGYLHVTCESRRIVTWSVKGEPMTRSERVEMGFNQVKIMNIQTHRGLFNSPWSCP